ncbi:MAG: membrane integrity-associated transporter subunit PqiC [Desulfamplus sp.]|nr:membrane integrity-associated transporter subunit PqiC [Desulfamplus sp.]
MEIENIGRNIEGNMIAYLNRDMEKKGYKNLLYLIITTMIVPILFLSLGCLSSQPSRFYMLTPVGEGEDVLTKTKIIVDKNITLGIGPVNIPKYLDRSQLVVRLSPNEIRLEDFHQWAGHPAEEIPSLLVENFTRILGIKTIYKYPWKSYVEPE